MSEPIESSAGGPRLFVEAVLGKGASVTLPPAQSHYLAGVMRLKGGDTVLLFDDRSGEWAAEVESVGRKAVVLRVTERTRPREVVPDLWLCAAPIRRGRIDWVAEKACELGVAKLVPVLTRRTVVDRLNGDRLRAHMIEAAEQCGRTALPELADAVALGKLLDAWDPGRTLVFCDEDGGEPMASAVTGGPAAILIGPEGGFDPAERDRLRAVPNVRRVSLGPRVLRADTAAVAAVAIWQSVAGDWRDPERVA
jgi:16S rRNA (uracil1498-N3)-methyltransferase